MLLGNLHSELTEIKSSDTGLLLGWCDIDLSKCNRDYYSYRGRHWLGEKSYPPEVVFKRSYIYFKDTKIPHLEISDEDFRNYLKRRQQYESECLND